LKPLQRNRYCGNPYCCNDYCCIVLAVSELASFLHRTRIAVLLADDERQCVDANPGACRLPGVSRTQLLAGPIDDWLAADDRAHGERGLGGVARSQRDAAVRNQRRSPHSGRTVAA
jgi:PAS domain-containing protein